MNRLSLVITCASMVLGAGSYAFAAPASNSNATMPSKAPQHMASATARKARFDQAYRTEGQAATQALNDLESKGYWKFSDFHRDGKNFAATVQMNGKTARVLIDPVANTVTEQG